MVPLSSDTPSLSMWRDCDSASWYVYRDEENKLTKFHIYEDKDFWSSIGYKLLKIFGGCVGWREHESKITNKTFFVSNSVYDKILEVEGIVIKALKIPNNPVVEAKLLPDIKDTVNQVSFLSKPSYKSPIEDILETHRSIILEEEKAVERTGSACITSEVLNFGLGGWIGDANTWKCYQDSLSKMTLIDGSLLPFDRSDFFIQVEVFDRSDALKKLKVPKTFFLPSMIFADKKEGDSIFLRYLGKIFALKIQQENHEFKFVKKPLKEVLCLAEKSMELVPRNQLLLGEEGANYWYYLGAQGVLYHHDVQNNAKTITSLQRAESPQLRPFPGDATSSGIGAYVDENSNEVVLYMSYAKCPIKNFDVIVNQESIIFYCSFDGNNVGLVTIPPRDIVCHYRWVNRYREQLPLCGVSLSEMKVRLDKATVLIDGGFRLYLRINGNGASVDKHSMSGLD